MSKAAELLKMLSQCADERSPASKEIDMKINESWDLHNAQFKKDGLKLHKEHKSNPDGQNNTVASTVLHTVKLPDNSIMFITKHNDGKVFAHISPNSQLSSKVKSYRLNDAGKFQNMSTPKVDPKVVADAIMQDLLSQSMVQSYDRRIEQYSPNKYIVEVRHWGGWTMPDGVEDDDGDYDWEVLTDKWSKILSNLSAQWTSKYPSLKIHVNTSEKNWINVQIATK